jgi:hypothetical protein
MPLPLYEFLYDNFISYIILYIINSIELGIDYRLWWFKFENNLHLGVREQKLLNTTA